jgi:hypothetical protein
VWGWIDRQRVISPAFTKRKRLLSPDQYEIVDVRTSRRPRRRPEKKEKAPPGWATERRN